MWLYRGPKFNHDYNLGQNPVLFYIVDLASLSGDILSAIQSYTDNSCVQHYSVPWSQLIVRGVNSCPGWPCSPRNCIWHQEIWVLSCVLLSRYAFNWRHSLVFILNLVDWETEAAALWRQPTVKWVQKMQWRQERKGEPQGFCFTGGLHSGCPENGPCSRLHCGCLSYALWTPSLYFTQDKSKLFLFIQSIVKISSFICNLGCFN